MLFACLIGQAQQDTIYISPSNYLTTKFTGGHYYMINGDLISSTGINIPKNSNYTIDLLGEFYFTGGSGSKAINLSYPDNVKIISSNHMGRIIAPNAQSCIEIAYGNNILISGIECSKSKWGIRCWNTKDIRTGKNYNFTHLYIHNTGDDNVWTQYLTDVEVSYCTFKNANDWYWLPNSSTGGDNLQCTYTDGYLKVHHNLMDKIDNGEKFNFICSKYTSLKAEVHDNIFNARPQNLTNQEDTTGGHKIAISNNWYVDGVDVEAWNNQFKGGSTAIYLPGGKANKFHGYNNDFDNHVTAIIIGSSWQVKLNNNDFHNGWKTYISGDGTADTISHNVFYDLLNPKNLQNKYTWVDNLINPKSIPDGYGAGYGMTKNLTIIDTVKIPKYYTVPKDSIVLHDSIIKTYEHFEVQPINIDADVKEYIQKLFNNIKIVTQ